MKKGFFALTGAVVGAVAGAVAVNKLHGVVDDRDAKVDKFKGYYHILNQWLILKQDGKSLEKYFIDNNYKTIAIYGMGELGNRLYDELKGSNIEVKYAIDKNAIDKNAERRYSEIDILKVEDDLPSVDAIIVTTAFAFNEIEKNLSSIVDYQIISLEDVVYEV